MLKYNKSDIMTSKYFKVSLYSDELLSLSEKRKYIDKLYNGYATYTNEPRNQGILHKFASAIGFKPVMSVVTNYDEVLSGYAYRDDTNYIAPDSLIHDGLETPVESFSILEFYIPNIFMKHEDSTFSYKSRDIAIKWRKFLSVVFPNLSTKFEVVLVRPKLSLRDFALAFFYRNVVDFNVTIEFASSELLSCSDIAYIIPKVQKLTKLNLDILQFPCDTCSEYSNGTKPYHIELDYI